MKEEKKIKGVRGSGTEERLRALAFPPELE
jgi:hypothetical protein